MLLNKLNAEEIEKLKEFRFVETKVAGESVGYQSLSDLRELPSILARLTEKIDAPNACVTSSILMKRMAFYAVIHLYAMSAFGKRLVTDVAELKLIDETGDKLWLPSFYLGNIATEEFSENRYKAREDIIEAVFSGCITPLIHLLREQTRLKEEVMWESITIYIHWMYGQLMEKEDYEYIFYRAPAKLFGPYGKNPLTPYAKTPQKGRQTCCLSYMMRGTNKKTCSTCPVKASREARVV